MAEHIQIGLKCPNCGRSVITSHDPHIEKSVPCIGCGHTIDKEEVIKQAKPQLIALAEKGMTKAFKKVPGFEPGKK